MIADFFLLMLAFISHAQVEKTGLPGWAVVLIVLAITLALGFHPSSWWMLIPALVVMALVALDEVWVTANYKERQLTHVHPGLKVEFKVDTYPGRRFTGVVDSIMAGTGAAFSLLPPENATGNYVKVVQRIPVKIVIDRESDPDHLLRVGMSVVPTILTGRKLGDIMKELNPFR